MAKIKKKFMKKSTRFDKYKPYIKIINEYGNEDILKAYKEVEEKFEYEKEFKDLKPEQKLHFKSEWIRDYSVSKGHKTPSLSVFKTRIKQGKKALNYYLKSKFGEAQGFRHPSDVQALVNSFRQSYVNYPKIQKLLDWMERNKNTMPDDLFERIREMFYELVDPDLISDAIDDLNLGIDVEPVIEDLKAVAA